MNIHVPQLCAADSIGFCSVLSQLGPAETYTFDFSNVTDCDPFGLLLSSAAIRQFRTDRGLAPEQCAAHCADGRSLPAGYLQAAGFPLSSGTEQPCKESACLPLTRIDVKQWVQNSIQAGRCWDRLDIIEMESRELAHILGRDEPELCKLFQYLIRELIRNTPEHAGTNEVWLCAQYWQDRPGRPVEIAVLDEGMGIMGSLCRNRRHKAFISSNGEALEWAIKPGVSVSFDPARGEKGDNPNGNSGYGLYIISEICRMTNGRFTLLSETDCLEVCKDLLQKSPTCFHGTATAAYILTDGIHTHQELIDAARKKGEQTARTIRNAFKKASVPSKGLLFE